jgi:predicted PurR-regulated permease PerM
MRGRWAPKAAQSSPSGRRRSSGIGSSASRPHPTRGRPGDDPARLLVCLGVGVYYALTLTLVIRLEFGLSIGILAGILTFIPYVGFATGFVLALSLALLQFGTFYGVLGVVVVFAIGQVLEANVLGPKLVGERVHLHPVWVIFALLAFGTVFGFLGVLLALPAAAVIGVLVRFAHRQYLASPLYDPANRRHNV